MHNTGKQSLEQKRKLEKMNMVLNNLEQKLKHNKSHCMAVATIIDMTVENAILAARLGNIKSNIPEIQQRISNLILSCSISCDNMRADILNEIYYTLSDCGKTPISDDYILKIEKTIDSCTEDYSTYIQTEYNAKYGAGNSDKDTSIMSIEELIMLI